VRLQSLLWRWRCWWLTREIRAWRDQEAKSKQKQLKRRAMGLDGIATDVLDNDELFSLSALKDQVRNCVPV